MFGLQASTLPLSWEENEDKGMMLLIKHETRVVHLFVLQLEIHMDTAEKFQNTRKHLRRR